MIPIGYMAKWVRPRPEWLAAEQVVAIYSVSACISNDFADYIQYWHHNGYWLFDAPEIIMQLAEAHAIPLVGTQCFYYEAYELEYHQGVWQRFEPEPSFPTHVIVPPQKTLEGYDVVTCSSGTNIECSPLSCNSLATTLETNAQCLLRSLEQALHLLETGGFENAEPGPYRVIAVYSVA